MGEKEVVEGELVFIPSSEEVIFPHFILVSSEALKEWAGTVYGLLKDTLYGTSGSNYIAIKILKAHSCMPILGINPMKNSGIRF